MLGLNLEDVGKVVMGSNSTPPYDLQEICVHENISKWAKWKPFKRTQVGAVTDEIRKSWGYGLSPINHDAPISYSGSLGSTAGDVGGIYQWIEDSLVTYRNNGGSDVQWDKPTEYYRLTDFSNYNQTEFYTGTERATYYLPEQNTYSPTLIYNAHQSSGSITLSDLEDIFDFDYFTNINYMEIALIYKYNGYYHIRRSNKTVLDLQQEQSSVSLQPYPFPTQVGSHVYEGFFVAIHSDELDYVFDRFGNPDYPNHNVEVIRFPDSYFKGTYVVKDPTVIEGEYAWVQLNGPVSFYDGLQIPIILTSSTTEYEFSGIVTVYFRDESGNADYREFPFTKEMDRDEVEKTIEIESDFSPTKIAIVCDYVSSVSSGSTTSKLKEKDCVNGNDYSNYYYYISDLT